MATAQFDKPSDTDLSEPHRVSHRLCALPGGVHLVKGEVTGGFLISAETDRHQWFSLSYSGLSQRVGNVFSMRRLARLSWAIFAVALLGGIVAYGWNSIVRGTDQMAIATLIFTMVAAIAASLGTLATVSGNRRSSQRQEQIGDDISRLAELTESSIEEARALRPDPLVHFLVGHDDEPVDSARYLRVRLAREVDIDRILEHERRYLLSTMPPEETPETMGEGLGVAFSRMAAASIASSMPWDDDRSIFQTEVDEYLEKLEGWIPKVTAWREEIADLAMMDLKFDNRGRVAANHVVVEISFPDPFKSWEEPPDFPVQPSRPKFRLNAWRDHFGLMDRVIRTPLAVPDIPLGGIGQNVSTPRYRDGSAVVEIEIGKLRHGVPETTLEPVSLLAPNDGEFAVTWRIHAENMEEPATGELGLEIDTHLIDGPPVVTLEELMSALHSIPDVGE